jgi:adenine phosphoribosyltransferase
MSLDRARHFFVLFCVLMGSLVCSQDGIAETLKIGLIAQGPVKMAAVEFAMKTLFASKTPVFSLYLDDSASDDSVPLNPVARLEAVKRSTPSAEQQDYWILIENNSVVVVQKKAHEPIVERVQEESFHTPDFVGTAEQGIATRETALVQEAIARSILKSEIETVADFPQPGVSFKDIVPLLSNSDLLQAVIQFLAFQYRDHEIDAVAALESRGFLLGVPLALALKKPFIPVRKKGKLPRPTHGVKYTTEYSTDEIEISSASLAGKKVLIVDDLLATGGTLSAAEQLIRSAGAENIESVCLIELLALKGRERLTSSFDSILKY